MIKLVALASGSSGNCYLLQTENSCLIIEAGVSLSEVNKALDFNISKVCGCIVTHEHKDHSKYIKEYLTYGIKCYMSYGTAKKLGIINNVFVNIVKQFETVIVDEWKLLPFDAKHDCEEPLGYLINHKECGNILFATDTYYLPNTFSKLNHILIECNYSKNILDNNNINETLKKRLYSSHMSLETCIDTLKANDLSFVQNIVLLHLSNNNSDANNFKNSVEGATGIPTIVADKGVTVVLERNNL